MRVTIQKSHILPVLSRIQGITGRKTNLAITTNVLIKTTETGVSFSATDLETGFEGNYPGTIETKGTIAISARKFFEIVRDFPSEEIVLKELDNHWVEIGNSTVEYHIVGMNPEDFPEIPKIETDDFFEIESAALAGMISKSVIISAAADDRRTHIIGVYAEWMEDQKNKLFRMVSTDGSRLSKVDSVFEKSVKLPVGKGILIPKKSLNEVGKFLDTEGAVRIAFKDNNFVVKKENETIIIRLLEGEFPKYAGHHREANRSFGGAGPTNVSDDAEAHVHSVIRRVQGGHIQFRRTTNSPYHPPTLKSASQKRTCQSSSRAKRSP
ncbi:MAG: DNA polymerase III subunit beta [Desulfobacterales bacterium]|nr:DNA polymerase III subunit beta [Desulfobacterales bacterium]